MNTINEKSVETYRMNAVTVGILFIIATAFLFVGQAFYGPALESPNFLETAYPNRITAAVGMLIEFTCVLAIPLIAVFVFPVLKKHSLVLALSYIFFRFFEAVLFIVVDINKLVLINVSQGYLESSTSGAAFYQNMGSILQAWNQWGWSFYILVFAIGALVFYTGLYRSRLVPRFISGWGLIAGVMIFISGVLPMLEAPLSSLGTAFEMLFVLPIAVQEMVLAVWLIVKGFNPSVLVNTTG